MGLSIPPNSQPDRNVQHTYTKLTILKIGDILLFSPLESVNPLWLCLPPVIRPFFPNTNNRTSPSALT